MLGLESTFNRMSNLATQDIYFDRQYTLDEILEGIDRVSVEDVQRVATDVFDERSLSLALLGKLQDGFTIERSSLGG
jgi:predicted Zn-dependent peptidase